MNQTRDHWQKIYASKSPLEMSWYQKEPLFSLQLIRNSGINKIDPVIDVGGGTSLLTDRLIALGYKKLSVLDISATSLDYAKNRLKTKSRDVEWIESDITQFVAPHSYTLWHDRAVFHFLTDNTDRIKYIQVLKRSVPKSGHIIIACFAIGGPNRCSGLDIVQYDAKKIQSVLGKEFLLVEQTQEIHVTPENVKQAFVYFRFIRSLT